jgi:predicted enzyme related to lactoylglutathione lyase
MIRSKTNVLIGQRRPLHPVGRNAGLANAPSYWAPKGDHMGRPVIHFEVMGRDGEQLRSFYADLFDWTIDADNPLGYGIVQRETNFEDVGIGGGIGGIPDGMSGHVTFYVEVPDIEAALAQVEKLGGTRLMGPTEVQPGVELGQFSDPEGHMVGLLKGAA